MTTIERLRALLDGATRTVVEVDHVYREVGRIVALDVERREFPSNALPALLDAVEAGSYYRRCVMEGFDEATTLEAWAVFDDALDRLDGAL